VVQWGGLADGTRRLAGQAGKYSSLAEHQALARAAEY
jgi:hypothetical protein